MPPSRLAPCTVVALVRHHARAKSFLTNLLTLLTCQSATRLLSRAPVCSSLLESKKIKIKVFLTASDGSQRALTASLLQQDIACLPPPHRTPVHTYTHTHTLTHTPQIPRVPAPTHTGVNAGSEISPRAAAPSISFKILITINNRLDNAFVPDRPVKDNRIFCKSFGGTECRIFKDGSRRFSYFCSVVCFSSGKNKGLSEKEARTRGGNATAVATSR